MSVLWNDPASAGLFLTHHDFPPRWCLPFGRDSPYCLPVTGCRAGRLTDEQGEVVDATREPGLRFGYSEGRLDKDFLIC